MKIEEDCNNVVKCFQECANKVEHGGGREKKIKFQLIFTSMIECILIKI